MSTQKPSRRKPRAFDPNAPGMTIDETARATGDGVQHKAEENSNWDPTAEVTDQPIPPPNPHQEFRWGVLLASTLFALFGLGISVWYARLVSVALTRDDWVGWTAWGLVSLAALAALVLILRELFGLVRLNRLARTRKDADAALQEGDFKSAVKVIKRLKSVARNEPKLRWDLERFRENERHMQTPQDLLGLADRILLHNSDTTAKTIIYRSARRVGIVTAVVPVAFVVVLFVLFENLAMIRRLAGAYGGRPGFFGGIRLFWWIIGHIAATGMIALTDDLWGQFLGQDVARRVSRRLGEGAFNGALTARLGVAAAQVCRPLPHIETQPMRIRSILRQLFPELKASELMRGRWGRDADAPSGDPNSKPDNNSA